MYLVWRIMNAIGGEVAVTCDRIVNTPPWGLFGGKPGKSSITRLFRKDGSVEEYRKTSDTLLHAGDVIAFEPLFYFGAWPAQKILKEKSGVTV